MSSPEFLSQVRPAEVLREAILRHVRRLQGLPPGELIRRRREKFLNMGLSAVDPSALTPSGGA